MQNHKLSIVFSLLIIFSHFSCISQSKFTSTKIKGVIELGADGFNSFIIKLDEGKNWELISSQFGKSYVIDEEATAASITKGIKNYIQVILDKGVLSTDVHFVVSSGASKQKSIDSILLAVDELGYVVNKVSAEEEGQLAFKSVVPDSQRNKTMVIDVGSANTKISWFEMGEIISISTYGSKFFKNAIDDSVVYKNLRDIALKMPKNKTKTVYLIGGVPYKYAKQTRQGTERFTKLAPLATYTPKDEKERCGALILSELQVAGNIEEYVFDWDSNFSIGFLLELPY